MGSSQNIIKKQKDIDKLHVNLKNESFETIQIEIRSIIALLKENKNDFNEQEFGSELRKYLNNYHRILYSEVSVMIFEFYQGDTKVENTSNNEHVIDNIIYNLTNIANKIDLDNDMSDYDKTVLKLLDHVLLANKQYSNLATTEKTVKPIIESEIKKFEKEHEEKLDRLNDSYKKDLNRLKNSYEKGIEKQKNDLLSQMISIISIFVGIAFVMFGGMSLLNELFDFSNMIAVPVIELLCLGSLIGIIMIAIIYSFMIFILKLTDKNIKGKSLLNVILIIMIGILTFICLLAFSLWLSDSNKQNYQKMDKEESINIETNITENSNPEKTDQNNNNQE